VDEELLNIIAMLRGQVAAMQLQIDEMRAEIEHLRRENKLKDFEIARLRQELYGQKSERVDPKQQTLALGPSPQPASSSAVSAENATDDASTVKEHRRKKPRSRFTIAPECVEHEVVDHFPAQTTCPHCEHALSSISYTSKTMTERVPVKYRSIEHRRHHMACRHCSMAGVSIASPVESPVPGCGGLGISLAVHIITQHFKDHLPYHRIAEIYEREGLLIDRGYLSRVGQSVGKLLAPVVEQMTNELLAFDGAVGCDGTSLRIFASPHCLRRSAYVLHGDGNVVFRALKSEKADAVLAGLDSFRGVLVTDAAKVFTGRRRAAMKIELALCNAHARRMFFKARESDEARAQHALNVYRTIARLEHESAAMTAEERTRFRQSQVGPVFDAFVAWAEIESTRIQARAPIGEAIDYLRAYAQGLRRFVDDGRVPWTNNESERLLRSIVVGRKAWLYRGTFESAQHACVLWSLMQSCRSLRVNPAKYLADVIEAMAVVPRSELHEWTPRAYAARAKR
jgi:transposase/regulator of replication initiation timing